MEQVIKKVVNYFMGPVGSSSRPTSSENRFPAVARRDSLRFRQDPALTNGSLIVEILVAFGLASILIPVIILGFISGSSGKVQQEQRVVAGGLYREAEEAIRSVRDNDWNSIAVNGTYHPVIDGSSWALSEGAEIIGDFTRSIVVSDTVPSDLSKKLITVSVSWNNILPTQLTSSFYLTRWKNLTFESEVSGELIQQGYGNWCTPSLTITALDLPKQGVANAISAIQGQIAAGTGENASGVSYANVVLTDPAYPNNPTAIIEGTFNGYKTNEVFTEENYAYLATDNGAKEVVIIDLENMVSGVYQEAGFFDAPASAGFGNTVATSGNVGYMIKSSVGQTPSALYSFDLTAKTGSRPILDTDGVSLPAEGRRLVVKNSRAYIVTASTTSQLVIVDLSNPFNLTIRNQIALPGASGVAVYINSDSTRAYVATAESSTQREFFIINIDEASPDFGTILGTYDTNGMQPKGVVAVTGPRAIIVGTGAEEYQVIDITDESLIPLPRCGGLQIDTGVNGIATVFTAANRAYSYIITGDASTELKIIEGGAGGVGGGGGTVDSEPFDAGSSAIFNRFSITELTPSDITADFRVAVSPDCINYNFVGPGGDPDSWYTSEGGLIPMSINPGRCFKYRVRFSGGSGGDIGASANVSVNYSP
jgi:type II secretory pathway pseudopilin PulG